MCSISPLPASSSARPGDSPVQYLSVYKEGLEEANRYKWILSERERRDLGDSAIRQWVREHWNGFLRARWVEHLYGRCFWVELDQNDFGLLT
jgi:hypothetical protein